MPFFSFKSSNDLKIENYDYFEEKLSLGEGKFIKK